LLQQDFPWRACLLSGGASRRMGRDKALLPHPEGGCWLERSLALLGSLEMPITLLSRHAEHHRLAEALAQRSALQLSAVDEPPPWEGPLRALQRLMALHPGERLLLCPVDMPLLRRTALETLRRQAQPPAAGQAPELLLAHDGTRLQPLLGVYPSRDDLRRDLDDCLATGERRLQGWLARHPHRCVALDPSDLRNMNRPQDWPLLSLPP
jgi:molybdopterin-guanine dinucleotide biosynthesis protein A